MTVTPKIADIQRAVAEHFGIPEKVMRGYGGRFREFARPRQIAMYVTRELIGASNSYIGRRFGDCDPTTVMHALRTIAKMRAENVYFIEGEQHIGDAIEAIIAKLKAQAEDDPRQHKLQLVA